MKMRSVVALVLLAAFVLTVSGGCQMFDDQDEDVVICAKCGQIEGSDVCCAADAVKCEKCGLAKGSPGCCRNLKPAAGATDVILCAKCGQVKGSDLCCKADAVKCEKCGLAKGSPGCCKIGK